MAERWDVEIRVVVELPDGEEFEPGEVIDFGALGTLAVVAVGGRVLVLTVPDDPERDLLREAVEAAAEAWGDLAGEGE